MNERPSLDEVIRIANRKRREVDKVESSVGYDEHSICDIEVIGGQLVISPTNVTVPGG